MTSATRPDLDEKFGFTKPFQLALEGVATFFSHRSAEPTTVFQRGWILVSALACSPLAHSASKSAATAGAATTGVEKSKVDMETLPLVQESDGDLHPWFLGPTGETRAPRQHMPITPKKRVEDGLGNVVRITVPTVARRSSSHPQGVLADGYRVAAPFGKSEGPAI